MADVFEFLIDGVSGLVPGGVDGKALMAGVCSKGQVGKGYLIGKRTDLGALLGVGPLVDRLRDALATGGQDPHIVAVPVAGQPSGYVGGITVSAPPGSPAPLPEISANNPGNADVVVEVRSSGAVETATIAISTSGGKHFEAEETLRLLHPISAANATIKFPDAFYEKGTSYSFVARASVGPVVQTGPGPSLDIAGEPLAAADVVVQIVKAGSVNEGVFRLSLDGGDTYGSPRTIPVNGEYAVDDCGVTLEFKGGGYAAGTSYACRLLPPVPSIVDVMSALERPLALHDVEFIHVVGPSDSVDWAAGAAKMDELWNAHRPTYIKFETRLPYEGESLNDFAAALLKEKADFAGRFVQVCAQFGEVSEASGQRKRRNWGGLQAGRVLSIPVQRATGRVRDGNIAPGLLPEGWENVQPALEEAGYLTARKYAGLSGAYWGDSRTMAEPTSDYRYEEVLRVTFKATRLLRIQALKSLYDEAGDPLNMTTGGGLDFLKANLEAALDTMAGAIPKELAGYRIDIPPGQDVANQGVAVEYTLIGIPIIRRITLYGKYTYAGSRFDPRLS